MDGAMGQLTGEPAEGGATGDRRSLVHPSGPSDRSFGVRSRSRGARPGGRLSSRPRPGL